MQGELREPFHFGTAWLGSDPMDLNKATSGKGIPLPSLGVLYPELATRLQGCTKLVQMHDIISVSQYLPQPPGPVPPEGGWQDPCTIAVQTANRCGCANISL